MIVYTKLFERMKEQGKTLSDIRSEKIIGQETLRKLKMGTGRFEEYDFSKPTAVKGEVENDDPKIKLIKEKKHRVTSIDSKSIEALCTWLECQPSDIMEVIPNTEENYPRLCEVLNCSKDDIPNKVPVKKKEDEKDGAV